MLEPNIQENEVNFNAGNWPEDRWPNFAHRELACSETGECEMGEAFMDRLQLLRNHYGHALRITSGYRSPAHSIEAGKKAPGTHAKGRAVDIACAGVDAYDILAEALVCGFTGIGVKQKGEHRFLHLDDLGYGEHSVPRTSIWSY